MVAYEASFMNDFWEGQQKHKVNMLKLKADEAYWRAGGSYADKQKAASATSATTATTPTPAANPIAAPEKQQPSWMSGYGSTQKEYDDAQQQRRVQEGEAAAGIRKGETSFNTDEDIRKFGATTDKSDQSFNFRQGVMEQISNRQKAVNTAQASDMWKNRNVS